MKGVVDGAVDDRANRSRRCRATDMQLPVQQRRCRDIEADIVRSGIDAVAVADLDPSDLKRNGTIPRGP